MKNNARKNTACPRGKVSGSEALIDHIHEDEQSKIDQKKLDAKAFTKFCTSNVAGAAIVLTMLFKDEMDLATIVDSLNNKADKVKASNLDDLETMLVMQVQMLDSVFKKMLIHMSNAKVVVQLQTYFDIAIKAQNQCRQTLSVIAELKNPKRTMFIKQQNNAINQQVNTAMPTNAILEKNTGATNELLIEAKAHEILEFNGAQEAIPAYTQLEAVGKI